MCLCCSLVIGQTYFYKFEYFVDSDTEVRSGSSYPERLHKYITFVNNKSVCYFSDEKGIMTEKESTSGIGYAPPIWSGGAKDQYQGLKNGKHVYEAVTTYSQSGGPGNVYTGEPGGYFNVYDTKKYLCFSQDYSRLNEWYDPYYYLYPEPNNTVIKMVMKTYRDSNMKHKSYQITVYTKAKSPTEERPNPGDVFY